MDAKVEHEISGREAAVCGCGGRHSLDVLKEVQRAYEQRMELISLSGGSNKLQKQVKLLQNWVSDLVSQNDLLARTVENLETEVTSRLLLERRRHVEMQSELRAEAKALRRRLARKDADLLGLLELLRRLRDPAHLHSAIGNIHFHEITESDIFGNELRHKTQMEEGDIKRNIKQDLNRMLLLEIRRLNKDTQKHEQIIASLREDISLAKYQTSDVSKVDAAVTVDICCPGMQIGDVTPVKDFTSMMRKESAKYHDRLEQLESNVKSSAESVRALRETNLTLNKEICSLRQTCRALCEQARAFEERAHFRGELVREMRRQLHHAKAKLKESSDASCPKISKDAAAKQSGSHRSMSSSSPAASCVSQQPRRADRSRTILDLESWDYGIAGFRRIEDEVSSNAE